MYYLLGASIGAIIFYFDNKFSLNKRTNWGIIPFISIALGAWFSLKPLELIQGDYFALITYVVTLAIAYGVIRKMVSVSHHAHKNYLRLQNEGSSKFNALIKTLFMSLLVTCLFAGFFIDIRLFFIAFMLLFVFKALENTPKKRFLKFQQDLATSKIRSVAMGLVEVEGKITDGIELKSKMGAKNCIGSFYYEYSISKDKEGKKSYTLQKSTARMNRFTIADETGSIPVICDPEYFVYTGITPHADVESGNRRYTEYLIEKNTRYLLIGSVDSVDGQLSIIRKPPHLLLGLSPSEYVVKWNKTLPMRRNLAVTISIALLLIAFVLITPMEYRDGNLNIYFDQISLLGSD